VFLLQIPRTTEPWNSSLRRASVNNFGYGGANSHVILENYIPAHRAFLNNTSLPSKVYVLSAKDEHAAEAMVANLRDHLCNVNDSLSYRNDLAYTLGERRSAFPWVSATSASSISELIRLIDAGKMKPRRKNDAPKIGFVFTGQGAQWWAMGRELIHAYPVFRETLYEADGYLREFGATWSLIEELHQSQQSTRVNEAALGQPVCVAVQIALVRLLESWGVKPTAVSSHSSGEIASAYAAGVFNLRSAMGVVYARGFLAADVAKYSNLGPGGMMAVGLGVDHVHKYVERVTIGRVTVACQNSPSSATISGDIAGINKLEELLKKDSIFARKLQVPAAYHSHHMEPLAKPYADWLNANIKSEPQMKDIIYSSPNTGQRMSNVEEIGAADHWVRSLTQPVLFVDSFTNMCFSAPGEPSAVDMVIELGAHPALSGPIQDITTLDAFDGSVVGYASCLVRKKNAVDTIHALACDLIHRGYILNMAGINLTVQGRVLTDLPKYAWNHQFRHWYEPRMNRAHRMLSEGPHDLLGSLVTGTNRMNPSWRHVVKPSSMPWITDHMLQGTIVYPGAGFICMALEGIIQAQQNNQKNITGYRLRDIDMLAALVIPEGENGVEVQLSLKPCGDKVIDARGWKEFQVFSVTQEDQWNEHCRGLVCIEYDVKSVPNAPVAVREKSEYRTRVSPSDVYDSMHRVGIQHGPIFRNLKAVQARPQGSLATIQTADTAYMMPYQVEHLHVIHPTTLDTVFQAIYAALPAAGAQLPSTQVPRSIKSLWVSADIKRGSSATFNAFSEVHDNDKQGFRAAVTVIDGEEEELVITIEDFLFQSIGDALSKRGPCENDKLLTSKWVPCLTTMTPEVLKQHLACEPNPTEVQALTDTKLVCSWFLEDALAAMTPEEICSIQSHFKLYYAWMKAQTFASHATPVVQEDKDALIAKVAAGSANGELMCNVGPRLADILCGRITLLQLIRDDQLLQRFYAECLKLDRCRSQMARLVRLYALEHPRAKMLEIGAGSGASTYPILDGLGAKDPLCASYDFTNVSDALFETAEEDLAAWKSLLSFRTLDIEQDPSTQGFEAGSYDLVIASQALNRTDSVDGIMANVHKLLRPGGALIMIERTHDQPDFRMIFGLLSGQCLDGEEYDEEYWLLNPSLAANAWNDILQHNHFNGLEVEVRDCQCDDVYSYSVMMSCTEVVAPSYHQEVVIAIPHLTPPEEWLDSLAAAVTTITKSKPTIQPYDELDCEGKFVVFLPELYAQLLVDPLDAQFAAVKNACTKSKGMLWVTRGGAMESADPLSSLASGFLRILRLEYAGKLLATLDLDSDAEVWSTSAVTAIGSVYATLFSNAAESKPRDFEFAERTGIVHVLRYFKDHARNEEWFPDTTEADTTVLQNFSDSLIHLKVESPGHLDSLVFASSVDQSNIHIATDELEICPQAYGITPRDIGAATNTLQDRALGFECAGTITQVGASASLEGYKVGDRVAVVMNGKSDNRIRIPWTSAAHIPSAMSFELAAALPVAYATAWISLMDVARIQKGDTILIHDAGSAVGQAAIFLAKYAGAEIFATINDAEHASFLRRVIGLKADHIFSSANSTFVADIKLKTNGRGVDIVLNTLEGSLLHKTLECVAPLGHFFELGKKDIEQNSRLNMTAFAGGITFSAIDIAMLAQHKGRQVHRALTSVLELMKSRKIRGVSIAVHDISDVVQAFRNAQSNGSLGRVVLSVKPESTVPVLIPRSVRRYLEIMT
jgi:acyl transferase domain-containing protein/NADPH:quinone reductase-like Zn-dependent oxidoreductase